MAISASANYSYTVWTPVVRTVVIRSHNCLLTPIVGEVNGAVKVANNATIMQKWPVVIAKLISQQSAPPYLSLFLLTQIHQVN